MPNLAVFIKTFALVLLLLSIGLQLLRWRGVAVSNLPSQLRAALLRHSRRIVLLWLLCLLLLLYGCGTVPSPASTRQPVPAALLVPPRKPTLLVPKPPASPSMTPGQTTPSTPKAAPMTGSGFNT